MHFALSLGLVLLLWFGFDYQDHVYAFEFNSVTGLYWMIAGNALYYLVIGLWRDLLHPQG